ncbi:MAG: hypothetical protein KBC84_09265, partial [Proteobacteria bacterium]|nr:hypothetical protein [Pseudomonadota bacterium]
YIMGVGTTTGSPITVDNSFKRDKEGKLVLTKLNPEVLKELAYETGGIYIESVSSQKDTDIIYKEGIKKTLKDSELSSNDSRIWNEYFQYPLFMAIILILLKLWKEKATIPVLLLIYLSPSICFAENSEQLGRNAKNLYQDGKYLEANEEFQKGKKLAVDDYRFSLGAGSSLYREKKFEESEKEFYDAANKAKNKNDRSASLFNVGNSQVQQNKLQEALSTYEESLKLNPGDTQIKDNIEYVKQLIEQQNKKQDKSENNNQQNKNDKENKSDKSDSNDKEQNTDNQQNKDQQTDNNKENNEQDPESQEDNQQKSEDSKQDKKDQSPEQQQKDSAPEKDSSENKGQDTENKEEAGGDSTDSQEDPKQEESNPLLDSIEEKSDNRDKYRLKKSNEQLKNYGLSKTDIEKNW